MPWCDPWNANQLTTDAPLEPRPVSRTQTSKPEVVTDLTHSAAGSWILVCSFPWLTVAITFTLPRPWNAAVNDTDWQPWLFCVKSDILTFPAWKEVAKEYRKKQQCWTGYAIVTAWAYWSKFHSSLLSLLVSALDFTWKGVPQRQRLRSMMWLVEYGKIIELHVLHAFWPSFLT